MSNCLLHTVINNSNNNNNNDDDDDDDDDDYSTHHPAKTTTTTNTSIVTTTACTIDNNNENITTKQQHTNNNKSNNSINNKHYNQDTVHLQNYDIDDTIMFVDSPIQVNYAQQQYTTTTISATNNHSKDSSTNTTCTDSTIDIDKLRIQFEQDGYICLHNILQNYQDWYIIKRNVLSTPTPTTPTSKAITTTTPTPTPTTKQYTIFTDYEQIFLDTFQSLYNLGHTKFPHHCQYQQYPTSTSSLTTTTTMLDSTVNTNNTTIISTTDTDTDNDDNNTNNTNNTTITTGTENNFTSERNSTSNNNNNRSNYKNDTSIRQIDKTDTSTTKHQQQQQEVYNIVYSLGIGIKNGFSEIVMRSPGRYELSLYHITCPNDTTGTAANEIEQIVPFINELKKQLWFVPLLLLSSSSSDSADRTTTTSTGSTINEVNYDLWDNNTIHIINISLVIGTPGCINQAWHSDGRHTSTNEHKVCHVLNIFIPLHSITNRKYGPTEYRPKSHYYTRSLTKLYLKALITKSLSSTIIPLLNISDILIFDYRILHRGTANTMKPAIVPVVDSTSSSSATTSTSTNNFRTYLVITVAQSWFYDKINFPKRSMYD